jgi:hypothetical protein
MIAAIYLYQLTSTRAPVTGLMDPGGPLFTGNPETRTRHNAPHGLFTEDQTVELCEFFLRQCRTEIGIARSDKFQSLIGKPGHKLPVTPHATSPVGHTERTFFTVTHQKPAALPVADPKMFSCAVRGHPALDDILDNFDAVDLFQGKHS